MYRLILAHSGHVPTTGKEVGEDRELALDILRGEAELWEEDGYLVTKVSEDHFVISGKDFAAPDAHHDLKVVEA